MVKCMILKGGCDVMDFLHFADEFQTHPISRGYGLYGLAKIYKLLLEGNDKPYFEVSLGYLCEHFVLISEEEIGERFILGEPLPKQENLYSLRKRSWLWDRRKEKEEV